MKPIKFSRHALSDLQSLQNYYTEQVSKKLADTQLRSIVSRIETLKEFPQSGRVVPEYEIETIREIIHPPFRIVYLLEKNEIKIIRIWRSERLLKLD